jgi:hypothetical protein
MGKKQRFYYDLEHGEVRTTEFDGSVPLAVPQVQRRRAGVAIPCLEGPGYILHTIDGRVFTADDAGQPFLTKKAVDAFEEEYVRREILRRSSQELPGLQLPVL